MPRLRAISDMRFQLDRAAQSLQPVAGQYQVIAWQLHALRVMVEAEEERLCDEANHPGSGERHDAAVRA